jgi:HK97 family phage prohead protease
VSTAAVLSFDGYAAVFHHRDSGGDIVMPGAFIQALKEAPLPRPLLWQHAVADPVGRIVSAVEDGTGLRVRGEIALDCLRGRDAAALLRAGALTGLSFGYRVRRAQADTAARARRLLDVALVEISLVTFPMQPRARVLSLG